MNWLRSLLRSPTPTRAQRPTARPRLETLEARVVPTVTYHGGALLQHVEAQGVYYGQDWRNNSTEYNQTGYLDGYLKYITNSSYMDMLTNAGYSVGRGSDTPGRILLTNPNKAYYLDDSTIRQNLQASISNRGLATPDANRLYVVFVESGVAVRNGNQTSINNFLGYHGAFAGRDANGHAADIRYAVIAYPGGYNAGIRGLSAMQDMTEVASHELAEAVTDPDVNYKRMGWYDDQRNGEIGDIVNGQYVTLNGYVVQKEAGKNDQALSPAGSYAFRSSAATVPTPNANPANPAASTTQNDAANTLFETLLSVAQLDKARQDALDELFKHL